MIHIEKRKKRNDRILSLRRPAVLLPILIFGCSPDDDPAKQLAGAAVSLPPLEIAADAPVLSETYPRLTSGALASARLMALPDGVFSRTEDRAYGPADVEKELNNVPPDFRTGLEKNNFFLMEQMVASELLEKEARADLASKKEDPSGLSQEQILRTWLSSLAEGIIVSDSEIEAFYRENAQLTGGAPLDQIAPQIKQYLLQQKHEKKIDSHIRSLGQRFSVAVDADWAAQQDALARDNAVDRARDSGLPVMASFGADSCQPCQMMKPFREAVQKDFSGKLEVVYVHVNKEPLLSSRYGVQGIPHTIFFDPSGNEFESRVGLMTQEQIEEVLAEMGVRRN